MRYILTLIFIWSFITFGVSQVEMILRSQWSDSSLPIGAQYGNTYNEVWGFAVNGHEYAVIGSTMGTHILDVTDPDNIFEREFFQGASYGDHIVHRDYDDYQGYLYAVSDESDVNESTLQIIDISGLPDEISLVYDDDDLIERTHNIFIDQLAGKMYACAAKGGDSAYKAIKIYSLEDPADPKKIGQYGVFGGENISHAHDIYAKNDTAFLNCGYDGLFVVDFSGDDPILLDRFTVNDYPEGGYNHSGWATDDMEYYYFADETHGSDLKVVDINNFNGMEIAGTFNTTDHALSIAHNQIIKGDSLYVSYYYDGLQVFDISDRENPMNVAHYQTSKLDYASTYEGAWGVYPFLPSGTILVSDMQEGLFVLTHEPPLVGTIDEEIITKVYPNPSYGLFDVQSNEEIINVQVFDLQGREVNMTYVKNEGGAILNIDATTGVYYLQIHFKNEIVSQKISIFK